MSTFGDGTLKQDLLEAVQGVKQNHSTTWFEFLLALSEVLTELIDIAKYENEE